MKKHAQMTIGQIMGLAVLSVLFDGFALWIRSLRFVGEARSRAQLGAAYVFTATVVAGTLWLILLGTAAIQTGFPPRALWESLAMLLVVMTTMLWLFAELIQTLRIARITGLPHA